MRRLLLSALVLMGCSLSVSDDFKSETLVSSKGEKIYINSLNWGVTGRLPNVSCDKRPGPFDGEE